MNMQPNPQQDGHRILVVEDSPTQAENLRYLLEKHHHQVAMAENGKRALTAVAENRPTLIISDIVMPEMDGFELCKRIKNDQSTENIPVILLTSLGKTDDVLEALESGADYFITKPYSPDYLLKSIDQVLQNRSLQKDKRMRIGTEIIVGGKPRLITMDQQQALSLLLSTYDAAVRTNSELMRVQNELRTLNIRLEDLVAERTAALREEIKEREQAEESLQRELEVSTALARLAQDLISHPGSLQTVAYTVLAHAKVITGSKYGFVSAIDKKTGENICYTFTDMMGKECQVTGEGRRVAFAPDENGKYAALCGHCLNTGAGFFTNSPVEHPQARGLPIGHIPIHQFLTVPVMLAEEVVGQIALANPDREYNQQDLKIVERLAGLYALAIQRERGEEDKKQLETYLRQAQRMEAAATLAGGIAHDFNNILAAMIGYVNLSLHEVPQGSKTQQNLEQVLKASRRARNLIQQIRAFSRQTEQEVQPLNICPIVKEALKLLRATLPATIEIVQDVPVELDSMLAEPSQVHQILMNLCTNASHAMRDKGGVLRVELERATIDKKYVFLKPELRAGPYLRLTVSDTGEGIEPGIVDRIFEPYFTTKETQGGTGLGLAVVHGIVKNWGGEITVYSEPGEGTTFHVYLPAISAQPKQEDEEPPPLFGQGERILFVDDEEFLVDVADQTLKRLGYQVETCTSGPQALEVFAQDPRVFDLLITDFNMPKMNGAQLALEMHKIRPDLRVILCTGFSERINMSNIGDLDIDAFLMKPAYESELSGTIRKVLQKK